jgi:tetratricopeptide (TPR) repeat protein
VAVNRSAAWLLVALTWGAPALAESPEEIFERGNSSYERGDFAAAADAYRTVLRYGIRDPRVHYNLGNAAFKLGRLGEAILQFERAARLDPTDADVAANLRLARSRTVDRVELPEVPVAVGWLRAAQSRAGPDAQAIAALVLAWVAGALVTWRGGRPGGWNAASGWALAALLCLTLALAVSWAVTLRRLEGGVRAVVLATSVEVLAGPGENNAALFTVHEGLAVEVRAERGAWIQVSLPNGLNGWIPRGALDVV